MDWRTRAGGGGGGGGGGSVVAAEQEEAAGRRRQGTGAVSWGFCHLLCQSSRGDERVRRRLPAGRPPVRLGRQS